MKRQSPTHASIPSAATNTARKGLQQYFTPEAWATALGAALPQHRRTIADLYCGSGSLVRGLANDTTREALGIDLDPTASLGGKAEWTTSLQNATQLPLRTFTQGDILDLYPLLVETDTRFDLLALNPPFSLQWPLHLVPEPLRKGLNGTTIDSTLATLRMIPSLLTERGEAMLIGNHATLERLATKHPGDFDNIWLWADMPSFFPGVSSSLRLAVLYFGSEPVDGTRQESFVTSISPTDIAHALDKSRRELFTAPCIEQPWEATRDTGKRFVACCDEMERRRNPAASTANVMLDERGLIRTWVSGYQERSVNVPESLATFLRSINRKHPLELTLQRGARLALLNALECGIWTIEPEAEAAITSAIADFDRDRAPLTPISDIQRIGWIDDAEELLCTTTFGSFEAGTRYPLSTETIEWRKEENRPRYHAGKRDTETVLVRGTDLRLTLHHPTDNPAHFIFNPDRDSKTRDIHSLEVLAAHFALPEVRDITTVKPDEYTANLALLDELEAMTP